VTFITSMGDTIIDSDNNELILERSPLSRR